LPCSECRRSPEPGPIPIIELVEAAQAERGALDLETSIHHYVDLADTTIGIGVTLLHLLTHTNGIVDIVNEELGEEYAALWAETPNYTLTETKNFLPLFARKEPVGAAVHDACPVPSKETR